MIVSRFAPSPTGLMHLGHAFSALTAFEATGGGRFLLRIEDIDQGRCREDYVTAIESDLTWLGVSWERPALRQSTRHGAYREALGRLQALGVLYRCFRTRADVLAEIASAPHERGDAFFGARLPPDEEAERLARGDSFAWRLSIARSRAALGGRFDDLAFVDLADPGSGAIAATPALLGDAVVARKDFATSYHLAAVVDDAWQGVTLVTRGEDLRDAAHLHVLLQALLGLETPRYNHHRLIFSVDGKRLAKRDNAATLASLRAAGATPAAVRALVGL